MAQKKEEKTKTEKETKKKLVGTRGRTFEGIVTKKFPTRIVIEFEKTVYIPKYERYYKRKTRIHAKLPENMDIKLGDYVKVRECRPLSKIIHFIVIEKLKSAEELPEKEKLKLKEEEIAPSKKGGKKKWDK